MESIDGTSYFKNCDAAAAPPCGNVELNQDHMITTACGTRTTSAHGHLRGELCAKERKNLARRADEYRSRVDEPRHPRSRKMGRFRPRFVRSACRREKRRPGWWVCTDDGGPAAAKYEKIPQLEAGIKEGRHGHTAGKPRRSTTARRGGDDERRQAKAKGEP